MNTYVRKEDFDRTCEAQGMKKQADGSWAKDGHYDKRVNYNTVTGNVTNGNGSDKRAYESTINDSIKRATGK